MKVHLAGFNVDTQVLEEMKRASEERDDITPEVLSAAYARISRDPRPIDEIRRDARLEVEKARRSNSTIIFRMGHHSVAEHAVFNLDITGVSRLAMEEIEKFRLSSYTEKSQRYITLNDDIMVPKEIKSDSSLRDVFVDTVKEQNKAYFRFFEKLKEYVFKENPDLAEDPAKHDMLEGWAKEDARYITSLSTMSQVGQTVNARTLELMLRRFASHELSEIKDIGKAIYKEISAVAPSVVLFHEANKRDLNTYRDLKTVAEDLSCEAECGESKKNENVELVEFTPDGDAMIASALMHSVTDMSFEASRASISALSRNRRMELFRAAWRNMEFYDNMLREFEYADLTFGIVLSAACFGQLKRHRMSTITCQPYSTQLGVTVPPSIKDTGLEPEFMRIVAMSEDVYGRIKSSHPAAAPYILTNAHRKRVLMKLNVRELYHISRLREDAHSQWDIRAIASEMVHKAKDVMPMALSFAGGKDRFDEIREQALGVEGGSRI